MDLTSYLMGRASGGGGSSVEVEALSVTANGTYTAEAGTAYSPVTVNVPVGCNYATGKYTLAANTSVLEFNPGLTFAPRMFLIYADNPQYEQAGSDGAMMIKGIPITISEAVTDEDTHEVYMMFETRTTWTDAHIQVNNYNSALGMATITRTSVHLPTRSQGYNYYPGDYTWEAWG